MPSGIAKQMGEGKALLSDKLQHTLEDTRHQWHPPELHSAQMWGPGPSSTYRPKQVDSFM